MEMGVETLWFMPITPISQLNKKGTLGSYYACADYTAINPEFGTIDDFKNLIAKAHEMGFKVIIDWVANHTGWDHVWTKQHPEWYKRESDGSFKKASGMDDIIELDFTNPELRNAMIDAMSFWVTGFDIDGFRCDLAFWVELNFWKEARQQLDAIKKLFWFGEFDPLDSPGYTDAFDASYTWTWMHKAEEFYKRHLPLQSLLSVLQRYDALPPGRSMPAWFTSNHDENSWNGTEYEKYGDMAKTLAVFSCTWDGIPLIYSGQELPNKKRLKFFDKDEIQWTTNELHEFYKTLLNLHSFHPALLAGDSAGETYILNTNAPQHVFAFLRKKENREVLVILKFSRDGQKLMLEDNLSSGEFRNVFNNDLLTISPEIRFNLEPWGFFVFEK